MKYYFKCPNCKNDEQFTEPSEDSTGLGCLLLVFGGFIPALLYADATRHRVQCARCGYIFRQPPLPRTSVSILATWVIGIQLLFILLTFFLVLFPDLTALIPDLPLISAIETIIVNHPKAIAFGLAPIFPIVLVVALFASWSSNRRAHKLLKTKFETEPKPFKKEW